MTSGISHRKKEIRNILQKRDFSELEKWAINTRNPLRTITSLLFDTDPLTCWRAIEALGKITALESKNNLENIRILIRRFFWMLNDESGNFCQYAPEAVGEILVNIPKLIKQYGDMLSPFLVEEPFEKGTRLAIARVAKIDKTCFTSPTIKQLIQSLENPDPDIRGTSIVALKALNAEEADDKIKALADDNAEIELYDFHSGELKRVTVGMLAQGSVN